jgi:ABC-type phosphate transport system substrate-binding protein
MAQITNQADSEKQNSDTLRIGVAVTTRHLMELAIPAFTNLVPDVKITSYIHETGNVVDDVILGKTSVAVTTRNLKDYEKEKSATIMGTPIGLDGLILAVSNTIPVKSLSFEQIVAIWTGKCVDWKELGGPDLPIVVIGRTKAYDPIKLFDDFMHLDSKQVDEGIIYSEKGKGFWSKTAAPSLSTDSLALELMKKTPGAITYFPLQVFYNFRDDGSDIKALLFNGIEASPATIANGEYFIHRRLNVITNGKPKRGTRKFVNFMLSDKGQKLVIGAGFLPIGKF